MASTPGYAGRIARVDLSARTVRHIPTEEYAQDYVGGVGIASKVYWDEVPPQVQAFDPENRLVFATGPCAGFQGLAGARWVVCGKSPGVTPESFSHCNLGGDWGTTLKKAGFDALIVQGQAERPVYLLVEDGRIEIRDASSLWGKGAVRVREILKGEFGDALKVVAVGLAGDNKCFQATLLADNDASGSGGLGAVMGSKRLKAIAVAGTGSVRAAHPQQLQKLLDHVLELKKDMPRTGEWGRTDWELDRENCSGCVEECQRRYYHAKDGSKGKFMCASSSLYIDMADKHYGKRTEVPFQANRLCDDYGVNTKALGSMIPWLQACYREGLLTEKGTGLPLSKVGSLEFIEALLGSIARREGFGDLLAQGLLRAADSLGSRGMVLLEGDITKTGDRMGYVPKAYVTTGLLHAVELREPIQQLHEVSRLNMEWVRWTQGVPGAELSSDVFRAIAKRFWGSELGADFSTYEGKALAAKMVQDRELAKESLILCDLSWPVEFVQHSETHVGDPSLESQVLSAVTGKETTEEDYYRLGARVLNLQRAILVRDGRRGRQDDTLPETSYTVPLVTERLNNDCLFPGKDGAITSRKGAVVDREQFQKALTEYYELRGWDGETGLPTRAALEGVGLPDVARDLAARGLLR